MSPATNPWQREACRISNQPGVEEVTDEHGLRVALGQLDRWLAEVIERAVARAKAWATLAPIERALIDMLTGEPVTLHAMLAELRHALPETWQAQLPDPHAYTEIQLVLLSLRARGLVQVIGLDGEIGDQLTAWGGFSEGERRETYGREVAFSRLGPPVETPYGTPRWVAPESAILDKADVKIAALSPSGTLTPGAADSFAALVEKAEQQLRGFDFSDRRDDQAAKRAQLDALVVLGSPAGRDGLHDDLVPIPTRLPPERLPRCARCDAPVVSMRRVDNIKTGDMLVMLACHGETREVRFTKAELMSTGKVSAMLADRLAAAWVKAASPSKAAAAVEECISRQLAAGTASYMPVVIGTGADDAPPNDENGNPQPQEEP